MKSTFIFLPTLLLFGTLQRAAACDCIYIPTFCEAMASYAGSSLQDLYSVHHIKVLTEEANGLKISVLKTLAGSQDLTGQERFILDGNGADCILFSSFYLDAGKEYVITAAIYQDSLTLSDCALSYLSVANGTVTGPIAPGVTEVPLDDFPAVANCGSLTVTEETGFIGGIELRPTLVTSWVEAFMYSITETADLRLSFFDATGRQVYSAEYLNFGAYSPFSVNISSWPVGTYFVKMEAGGACSVRKIVKVNGG